MNRFNDPAAIARIVIVLLLGFIMYFSVYNIISFSDNQSGQRVEDVKRIIEKALVQCYALEGAYPTNLTYVEKYGVIFDNTHYRYFYEWTGGNLMPFVAVIKR